MGKSFSKIILFYIVIICFSYWLGFRNSMDFKTSRRVKIFQHLLLAFVNKRRTTPRVCASIRHNEGKSRTGLTWLSAIKTSL